MDPHNIYVVARKCVELYKCIATSANKKEENIAKFGENEGILVKILQKDQLTSYKKPASSQ